MQHTVVKGLFGVALIIGSSLPYAALAEGFTNSIGMEFVKVPAGSFRMGSNPPDCPADDPFTERNEHEDCLNQGPSNNEMPAHKVTISQDFYMGKYEVTQAQWYAVMGNNPANFKSEKVGEDSRNFPVENVSWNDVQQFVRKLNAKEGKDYRLPTEAEWEYACRSGGKDEKYCGGDNADVVAWYDDKGGKRTHRVGTKQANGLGIYDMSGNVSEWCYDWYGGDYYGQSPASDPQGPSRGSDRVRRGGTWDSYPRNVGVSNRVCLRPAVTVDNLGFRLVLPSSATVK